MSTQTQAQLSMSTEKQALKQSMQNQWTRSCQLSMSTQTHAQLIMSTWTQALKRSIPNRWTRSYQLSMPSPLAPHPIRVQPCVCVYSEPIKITWR